LISRKTLVRRSFTIKILSAFGDDLRKQAWVLKKSVIEGTLSRIPAIQCSIPLQLSGSFRSRCYRSAEEPHQSFDVLGHRCQEELLPHELQSAQTQMPQSDLILQFREQGFHLLSLPLCFGELWRVDQLPRTLSGWFVLVDDQAPEGSTGALWSERARTTLFACPDVVEGAIPINSPSIVERLTGRAELAIVFRFVRESLGAKEWAPLSVDRILWRD
jgi:hypothetical protein